MKTQIVKDVFDIVRSHDLLCIPTNGTVQNNGDAVMGKGFALEATKHFVSLASILGQLIRENGNICQYIGRFPMNGNRNLYIDVMSFPTKEDWRNKSNPSLIKKSCMELNEFVQKNLEGVSKIYLPAPGCGAGGLEWKEVESILEEHLIEDRYRIIATTNLFHMKGRLVLSGIGKIKEVDLDAFPTKRLFIVRKVTASVESALVKYNLQTVPQLSPSELLFHQYLNWKKNIFTPEDKVILGQRSIPLYQEDAWWSLYAPAFIEEMRTRSDLRKCMLRIMELLDSGENVLLVCYCPNPLRCHRGIIGAVIQQKGYTVEFN